MLVVGNVVVDAVVAELIGPASDSGVCYEQF